jgi:Ser/Thr protein kinase RdoA (MazF antagonist)
MSEPEASTAARGLVHGMGKELVEPDWPALTSDEMAPVLGAFLDAGRVACDPGPEVVWSSPRPMSAAAVVRNGSRSVFVKRHHRAVRSPSQLETEHAFAEWLRRCGQPVPLFLRTADGATVTGVGDFVYEVQELASGLDLYRDAVSWSPFLGLGQARAAGRALAELHRAAADFALPPRAPAVLMPSTAIVTAADPSAALDRLLHARPGLARSVADRPLVTDFAQVLLPWIARAAPALALLRPQWTHGDWHASNLTWTSDGPSANVACVLDLGLSNRTFAMHDLAIAIERNTIDWLDLAGTGGTEVDLEAVDALLDGYEQVVALDEDDVAGLVAVLPVAHLEYALSEVEYFGVIVDSPANADLAYDGYLLGHARWFGQAAGTRLLDHLRRRVSSVSPHESL